jgi:tetratricopeptide (TPR) repeat protein
MPTMRQDAYGLPVSTDAVATVEAYDHAVEGLLSWDARALERFRAASALDPGLALAHAGAAVCLFLEERFAEAQEAAKTARTAAAWQTDRERRHVEGLALLVEGKGNDAATVMRAHLADYPRDLLVFQRLYFVWFWQGKFPEMVALGDTLARYHPGSSFMLGLQAFALEQAGRCDEAVRMALVANQKNPRDAWAIHALAHSLYEMAAFDTGITRLPPAIEPCTHLGWFRNHLLWHLALMHMGRGEYEVASDFGRRVFEGAPSSIPGDLHDSISLLWRLELLGREVGERWKPFARIAGERLDRQALLFHAAHLAMALSASGDWTTAERQLGILRERGARDRTGLVREVLVPLVEGIQAFATRDYRRSIERIEPLTPRIVELGGSRAQRDVFHDTLLEACFRAGDADRAERLLTDRVARRPDRFWKTRAAAGAAAS